MGLMALSWYFLRERRGVTAAASRFVHVTQPLGPATVRETDPLLPLLPATPGALPEAGILLSGKAEQRKWWHMDLVNSAAIDLYTDEYAEGLPGADGEEDDVLHEEAEEEERRSRVEDGRWWYRWAWRVYYLVA
jgi:hypothetical protein